MSLGPTQQHCKWGSAQDNCLNQTCQQTPTQCTNSRYEVSRKLQQNLVNIMMSLPLVILWWRNCSGQIPMQLPSASAVPDTQLHATGTTTSSLTSSGSSVTPTNMVMKVLFNCSTDNTVAEIHV
ncbi:hypothetical protein Pelo_1636 [Pelomyxa schiedti]|nr:hypothetical protein Pelo_1636 [Pelomyxa schiedti]